MDGKTGVNLLTKGNLVVADQTLLTTIVSQDPMYVYFDVDESTMLHVQQLIRKGKATSYRDAAYPVEVGLTSEKGYPHRGHDRLRQQPGQPRHRDAQRPRQLLQQGPHPHPRPVRPRPHPRRPAPPGAPSSPTAPWAATRGSRSSSSWATTTRSPAATSQVGAVQEGGLREITSGLERGRVGHRGRPVARPARASPSSRDASRCPRIAGSAAGGRHGSGAVARRRREAIETAQRRVRPAPPAPVLGERGEQDPRH